MSACDLVRILFEVAFQVMVCMHAGVMFVYIFELYEPINDVYVYTWLMIEQNNNMFTYIMHINNVYIHTAMIHHLLLNMSVQMDVNPTVT